MRTIYIDSEHKCHTVNDGTMIAVEEPFFEGKCDAFVEGFCYEVRENSTAIYAWKPYSELDAAQREYERHLLKELQENSILTSDLEAAYQEGVNSV